MWLVPFQGHHRDGLIARQLKRNGLGMNQVKQFLVKIRVEDPLAVTVALVKRIYKSFVVRKELVGSVKKGSYSTS